MFKKQHIICLLLAALMLFSLAACGKGDNNQTNNGQNATQPPAGSSAPQNGSNGSGTETPGNQTAVPAKLSGKLTLIELDDRDASVLRGMRIIGNQFGTQDDINGKKSSLTDVRCLFALNEWVEFYPDTDKEYALRCWVLKHRDDWEYYNTCKFSDLMPNFASYCDLHYPADAENPDEWYWGNFYLHPEECEPGYYDFVFTYEGKAIGILQTRFYNEAELDGKTGAELEALMHE